MRDRFLIGLMSGTSCDGVDAALVEISGRGMDMRVRYLDREHMPYDAALRRELVCMMAPAATRTEELATANVRVGQAFAECALRLLDRGRLRPDDVSAIGSHGQTICHLPPESPGGAGATLQIGEPSVIAARTGIRTVADFRTADVALGGQGAPLVPWTDHVLFHSDDENRIVLNIGGIANVALLPAGAGPERVIAFDTGPGCMVIDEIVRRLTDDPDRIDRDGEMARTGKPDPEAVEEAMQQAFFEKPLPKSAGREQFGRAFAMRLLEAMTRRGLCANDCLATAALLTARSIAAACRRHMRVEGAVEVILCGGGSRNRALVEMLASELPGRPFRLMDEFGIPVEAKECLSFAMLAAARLDGVPANLPQVTGATRACLLGKIVEV